MPTDSTEPNPARFTTALLQLGFSQYESRCYVGLLGPGPQTGYAVSKTTGVPQPKVYEALRKLVSRGAARQLPGEPVLFAAVPPDHLLDDLTSSFEYRIEAAREASRRLEIGGQPPVQEPVARLANREAVLVAAVQTLSNAGRRVYLSATAADLLAMREAVQHAVRRGVDVVVLSFGKMPFQARGVRVFRHATTDGAVSRHHQARHIAVVADSRATVFGLAPDGNKWSGIQTESGPIIAAIEGYIRHDIDMQQVYGDFRTELVEAYGLGLQQLESYRTERGTASDVDAEAAPRTG